MFALDANVILEMTRPEPNPGVVRWLQETPRLSLFLPSVVVAELYAGIEVLPAGRRRSDLADFIGQAV